MQRCGAWGAFVLQMLANKLHHSQILFWAFRQITTVGLYVASFGVCPKGFPLQSHNAKQHIKPKYNFAVLILVVFLTVIMQLLSYNIPYLTTNQTATPIAVEREREREREITLLNKTLTPYFYLPCLGGAFVFCINQ